MHFKLNLNDLGIRSNVKTIDNTKELINEFGTYLIKPPINSGKVPHSCS